jgi:hypothetical protein
MIALVVPEINPLTAANPSELPFLSFFSLIRHLPLSAANRKVGTYLIVQSTITF